MATDILSELFEITLPSPALCGAFYFADDFLIFKELRFIFVAELMVNDRLQLCTRLGNCLLY